MKLLAALILPLVLAWPQLARAPSSPAPGPAAQQPLPPCAPATPAGCMGSNGWNWELLGSKPFDRALKAFAGPARSVFATESLRPLPKDLFDLMNGPPDFPRLLADGNYLFIACMIHNCPEKGAIVLSPRGAIVAVAMLTSHFNDQQVTTDRARAGLLLSVLAAEGKAKAPIAFTRLDIFVRTPVMGRPAWREAILSWAKAAYAGHQQVTAKYYPDSGLTETLWQISDTNRLPGMLVTTDLGRGEPDWMPPQPPEDPDLANAM